MSVHPREFEFPCYVLRRDTQNQWRWVYFARNGEPIAVSSESYKRVEDCRHGIEIMTRSAGSQVYVEQAHTQVA